MPTFRPGTNDEIIWNNINVHNEYELPDDMTGWTVIDIGAHIGSFSYACLTRGASHVFAYEPFLDSYVLLGENLFGEFVHANAIQIFPFAVWTSGTGTLTRKIHISDYNHDTEPPNTGSPSAIFGEPTTNAYCVGLDSILTYVNRPVDLLKLDCEGSEWPILFTSKKLYIAKRIIGEYHECTLPFEIDGKREFKIDDLVNLLEPKFSIRHFRHGDSHLGMFFAERKQQ